jgi:HD-GYP domain-containing protein (c-di-GMP phosphodiesterase class II)
MIRLLFVINCKEVLPIKVIKIAIFGLIAILCLGFQSSHDDPNNGGKSIINLNGDWAFYPNQLLTPNHLENNHTTPQKMKVPGFWDEENQFGTYKYEVIIPTSWVNKVRAIYLPRVFTSYSLWINGSLTQTVGKVGESQEKSIPLVQPKVVYFVPTSKTVEIVLQVSGYHHRKSGIAGTISMGVPQEVAKKLTNKIELDWFSIGALLMIGLFNLTLFFLNRRDKSTLAFGLFCFLLGFRVFVIGETYVSQHAPNLYWEIAVKLDYIILFLCIPLFIKYLELLFNEKIIIPGLFKGTLFLSLIVIAITASTSTSIFTYFIYLIYMAVLLLVIYFGYVLVIALKRKQRGGLFLFFTFCLFALAIVNDILNNEQVINTTELVSLGLVIFCTGQSYNLGRKISDTYKEVDQLNQELEENQMEVIYTLGEITESRSKETGNHVRRVANYSYLLAQYMNMKIEDAEIIRLASSLHDIGKIAIPDQILNKPAKLTAEEFEIIKTHTTIGHQMLKHSSRQIMKIASVIALTHHERFDGNGYPNQLKGYEIPIAGRIIAVADVFDALSNDRVYKKAWALEEVIDYFKTERGKHFDPTIVDCLLSNIEEFKKIKEEYMD